MLDNDIYFWASSEAKCIRLSTIHNRTGCATYNEGMSAQLRYCSNSTDVLNLLKENPSNEKIAVVLPLNLLTTNIINNLAQNLTHINGIIFLQDDDNDEILKPPYISQGYSDDLKSPKYYLKPETHQFHYEWNPYGTYNNLREYKFAIITISASQSSGIKNLAQSNENNIRNGDFGEYFVEFTYPMFARNDSAECLKGDNCLPVGGYSVWTTFQDYNINASLMRNETYQSPNDLIIATTSMDTTCLFHQNICRGGNANIAGLVGWLASIEALSHIKKHMISNENITKQIIFAAFGGEAYDSVGSRKFVHDILPDNFECEERMNYRDTGFGCWKPYTSSMDFKKLNFSKIKAIIELSQIGMASKGDDNRIKRTLYAHYERPKTSVIDDMITDAIDIANNISVEQSMGFNILSANATDLPGTPPSSYWSFLNENPSIPGIVFTDHAEEYKNKWYHSVYDSYYNNLNIEQICMASTLYARLLYKLSLKNASYYNESFISSKVNADCLLVEQLLECLLLDMTCDLINNFAPKSKDATPTHYSSVYRIIEDNDIHGTSKFIFRYISNLTRKSDKTYGSCGRNLDCASKSQVCGGTNHGKFCMDSSTYFHAAVDPNLKFNYASKRWKIDMDTTRPYQPLIFTESMWNSNIGTRFYRKETDKTQIFMLLCGITMIILNFSITYKFKVYCKHKFPYLSRG